MPVLVVSVPGRPDVVRTLGTDALVVGRADTCDLRIEDPKASGRHLRLAPLEGGWMVQDLGSTRGVRVGQRRVQRAVLSFGDTLVAGGTRIRFLEREPDPKAGAEAEAASRAGGDPVPRVGGTLGFKAVGGQAEPEAPVPSIPLPVPPTPPPPPLPPPDEAPTVVTRPIDARSMSRALVLLVVGLLVVGGVELVLGPKARVAKERAEERQDLRDRIQRSDIDAEAFAKEVEIFLDEHPGAEEKDKLIAYLAGVRALEAERVRRERELNSLASGLHELSESEVRGILLELQRSLPGDVDMARQARLALENLDHRHAGAEAAALDATIRAAQTLVDVRDPAGALRRLTAFRNSWPTPTPEALDRLREAEDRAIEAANGLQEYALTAADAIEDPLERRRALAAAWRGLAGTPQGERVAEALRFTRTQRRPTPGAPTPTPAGTGTGTDTGTPPAVLDEVLAQAAVAERMVDERRWNEALVALKELIDGSDPGPLQREWIDRSQELRLVTGLVDALGVAAASEKPPKPRLSTGKATVRAADAKGVEVETAGGGKRMAWPDVPREDLLPLLTPRKPTSDQRFGLAVLAASLSRGDQVVAFLLPLFEDGERIDEASRLVARHLYGRAEPPAGGYRVYKGELVDREGYERRLKQDRVVALTEEAHGILARVLKAPAFKKLGKLKALREELDKRRRHAVLAIFNEKHYPYPYQRGSKTYTQVQQEIDERVARVREVWDDGYKVKITRKGPLGRLLDKWDEALAELKRLETDVTELEKEIAPYVTYVTGEPVTVREYFRNDRERKLFAYNRWVLEVYNPKQDREATLAERRQTRITNDYRMLIGYAAAVTPGAAPYEAIDDDTVEKILDAGRIEKLVPLRAVRIDDRLVRSSRLHSQDMQKRGFFSHPAPANPATGEPRTSPFDRMQKAGYKGGGASENIANGSTSPEGAHNQWVHSSGHHRNILSPWHDQGVGQAGRLWTQNFGTGGGRRPVIESEPPPSDEEPSADKGDERAGDSGRRRR